MQTNASSNCNYFSQAYRLIYFKFSKKIFMGAAKNFLGGAPSKFSGANDSRGGGIFLKKMKFPHRVEISIISVFQYYSTIKTL